MSKTILLSSALLSGAIAQLLTCGDVGCPVGSLGYPENCILDDKKVSELGISMLNTSLDRQPLSWTLTVRSDFQPGSLEVYHRDFYLGQPPSLDFESTTSTNGCALFFDGIASDLDFGVSSSPGDLDNGTCDNALTNVCVTEWRTQIQDAVNTALESGGALDCDALARTLQNNPPAHCATQHGSWGVVSARPISGPDSPQPIQLSTCRPVVGSDYQLRPFESFNATVPDIKNTQFIQYLYGITPVVTILSPIGGTAEVHLNCLKTVRDRSASEIVSTGSSTMITVPKTWLPVATTVVLFLMNWQI